ncbi:MAG: diphosphate--fructose-6-phosphate 1-phosphotransferase, partial [Spirochaetota bacterium]
MNYSPLQTARYQYKPKLPSILRASIASITPEYGQAMEPASDKKALKDLFPHTYGLQQVKFNQGKDQGTSKQITVGVVLSGGQAPGGHNVITGLYDALRAANPASTLLGFLNGPSGILEDEVVEITDQMADEYRNTGGFDIIGSGRTKIETEQQFAVCEEVCKKRDISAIVIIGGDDSNTNAAVLAEYFQKTGAGISVIGVPKTIDGDLKNDAIEISFGFDTATKTYAELIGNIERDTNSAKKYWHFIKLMGRSASHIALEAALQTQPTVALISEEVAANKTTLKEIVDDLAEKVVYRSKQGEDFGVVLVPEGLIEFIPEMKSLISELNSLLAKEAASYQKLETFDQQSTWVAAKLSSESANAFTTLPDNIKQQLLMDRDPHGNVQVSRIETEKLLIELVDARLKELKAEGSFSGKFSAHSHFFGYEGRCAFPSNFDADYCYSLGYNAYLLISCGLTGYISSVTNLSKPADQWEAGGIPITSMMNIEQRHGEDKPVIKKALVELDGKPFKTFAAKRETWYKQTSYTYP